MTPRIKRVIVGLAPVVLISVLFFGLDRLEQSRYEDNLRAEVSNKLSRIRSDLGSEVNSNFFLTRGIMAYLALNPELDQSTFEALAADLFRYHSSMRNIALAPNNVISLIYPLEANRGALGADFRTIPEQWETVNRAIEQRKTVIAGPLELVQGGQGIIGRTPIFLSDGKGGERYWGLVSVVLDPADLFATVGLDSAPGDIQVAIRGKDGLGAEGDMVYGDPAVFEVSPVLASLQLPEGYWQMAAIPANGWGTRSPNLMWMRATGVGLAFVLALFTVLWQKRQDDARENLQQLLQKVEKANDSLVESESFLNAIIENIPDTIFLKDAGELRYVRFNRAGEKLLGYSRQEMVGKNDYDIFPHDLAVEFTQKDREVLDSGKIVEIAEEYVQSRDQGVRVMRTKKIPLKDKKGRPQFLMGISEDITERKLAAQENRKLETALRQAQKMEALGILAGGIAHDFNNVLAAVLGYAELAWYDLPEGSPASTKLKESLRAGERAKELIRQILNFSRQGETERVPLEPYLIIKEVLKFLRASIPSTIRFDEHIDRKCGRILADPTQFHQVVMNLCTNAAQAMADSGGVLEVRLDAVTLGEGELVRRMALEPGRYLHLRLRDSGVGIDQEILDRIFEPYFTTKEVGKGSGMGLAVVMGIVKTHGGGISVVSQPGEGATFDLYFPAIDADSGAEVSVEPVRSLPTGHEQVLVVDDEEDLVRVTRLRLTQLGYKVTTETSSRCALELFLSKPDSFDLVISDQTMPDLTGEALARRIWEVRPDIPIVICTGYSANFTSEKAAELGISAYLLKPVKKNELANTVRVVLDKAASTRA